mgnify:CR=1 FL=1
MKKLLWFTLSVWLLATHSWGAYPDVAVVDNCTRANQGPPLTGHVNNGGSGWRVAGNICIPDSAGGYHGTSWNTSYGPDMEGAITLNQVPAVGTYNGLFVRLQTANNSGSDRYELDLVPVTGANNDELTVWKCVSSVSTQLGATYSLGVDLAVSDVIGLRAVGTTITPFRNGSALATRTDSAVSGAGYVGFQGDPATPQTYINAFYAGTLAADSSSNYFRRRIQ